ncbi:hypothetical protein ACOMHN_002919 [Nucella lapillus]
MAQEIVTIAEEEEHRWKVNDFIAELCKKKNSKICSLSKYQNVVAYLKDGVLPATMDRKNKAKFKWYVKTRGYALMDLPDLNDALCIPAKNRLKEEDQDDSDKPDMQWLQVVHQMEAFDIISNIHNGRRGHILGYKKTLAEITHTYDGIPRSVVQHFVNNCPTCLRSVKHEIPTRTTVEGFLSRVQIELIDMQNRPDRAFKWISLVTDYWTKFIVLWPLTCKSAWEVAEGLQQRVFANFGLPKIVQSCQNDDREFVKEVLSEVVKLWEDKSVIFINGRPGHLMNAGKGFVEKIITEKRQRLGIKKNQPCPWSKWLPEIQLKLNLGKPSQTSSYDVVFRQPHRAHVFPASKMTGGQIVMEESCEEELVVIRALQMVPGDQGASQPQLIEIKGCLPDEEHHQVIQVLQQLEDNEALDGDHFEAELWEHPEASPDSDRKGEGGATSTPAKRARYQVKVMIKTEKTLSSDTGEVSVKKERGQKKLKETEEAPVTIKQFRMEIGKLATKQDVLSVTKKLSKINDALMKRLDRLEGKLLMSE